MSPVQGKAKTQAKVKSCIMSFTGTPEILRNDNVKKRLCSILIKHSTSLESSKEFKRAGSQTPISLPLDNNVLEKEVLPGMSQKIRNLSSTK